MKNLNVLFEYAKLLKNNLFYDKFNNTFILRNHNEIFNNFVKKFYIIKDNKKYSDFCLSGAGVYQGNYDFTAFEDEDWENTKHLPDGIYYDGCDVKLIEF